MVSKLHFLGTSCMVPTKERNHLSVAFEYEGSIFLFDCGEATQNQIKTMKLPIGKIKKIFISHWHGDHCIGLIGLMLTLSNTEGVDKFEVHGPVGSKTFVDHMLKCTVTQKRVPVEVFEHNPEEGELLPIIDNAKFTISCARLNHSTPCIGFRFDEKDVYNIDKEKAQAFGLEQSPMLARAKMGMAIEHEGKTIQPEEITYLKKGMSLALVFDTRPCVGADLLAKDVDHLVMEATFSYEKHAHKAEEYDHMSAKETAEVAQANGVNHLIITHFSQRYKDVKELEQEARDTFENTTSTYDLMTLKLK